MKNGTKQKTIKVILISALLVLMLCAAICATACNGGDNGDDLGGNEAICTVRFDYNYSGAPAAVERKVVNGKTVSRINTMPARDGFQLDNWYTDAECTMPYDFSSVVTKSTTLYAGWKTVTTYVFEAEYVDLDRQIGNGFSGTATGSDMVAPDTKHAEASNGFYVTYLYSKGVTLEFVITADKAESNCALLLRVSAEYADITLKSSQYSVSVNGTTIGYEDIVLDGVPAQAGLAMKKFQDYIISTNISIHEGENTIKLVTNNNTKHPGGGTMNAIAPIVDCIKINTTEAELDWTPVTGNI